jgi:SAM-dependent methyltransferase
LAFSRLILQNFNAFRIGKARHKLSFKELLLYYTPNWYHDFSELGATTYQFKDEIYPPAQRIKKYKIFEYIDDAIVYVKNMPDYSGDISAVELFCADGFYANYMAQKGATKVTGIDIEENSGEGLTRKSVLAQAKLITKILGNDDKATFQRDDVFNLSGIYDVVLCVGGLYHLNTPEKLLRLLREKVRHVLIIQTVVTLETEDENYFISPTPEWGWGCRFTHAWLLRTLRKNGWSILHEYRNELAFNSRQCDRGSSYVFCVPNK